MDSIINFLSIPSVAAFIGAFTAFLLVVLNDWRRNLRKIKQLTSLILINKRHAEGKWKTIENNLKAIKEFNKIIPGPILPFSIDDIKRLESEVLYLLDVYQKQSLDAICYTMEATDSLIRSIEKKIDKISLLGRDTLERHELVMTLPSEYDEILVNLARFVDMANLFVGGKFNQILTKQYIREYYEKWSPHDSN